MYSQCIPPPKNLWPYANPPPPPENQQRIPFPLDTCYPEDCPHRPASHPPKAPDPLRQAAALPSPTLRAQELSQQLGHSDGLKENVDTIATYLNNPGDCLNLSLAPKDCSKVELAKQGLGTIRTVSEEFLNKSVDMTKDVLSRPLSPLRKRAAPVTKNG